MHDRLLSLIRQAQNWRRDHIRAGRGIEAAACAIRIRALEDALAVIGGDHG